MIRIYCPDTYLEIFYLFFMICLLSGRVCNGQHLQEESLYKIVSNEDQCGYINSRGDTVITFGKYRLCFTDTLQYYAIVMKWDGSIWGIDRNMNDNYMVFKYDNGPDYPSEGLFRIIMNNKIGYAEVESGRIMIEPEFSCAYPFQEGGIAKVSYECKTYNSGEHRSWKSDSWFFINKKGERVNE